MKLKLHPLGNIGREVVNLSLDDEIDQASADFLRSAWNEHAVLLFRSIGDSPEKLLRLSRVFGELEPHPIENIRLPQYPELILLTNIGGPRGPIYSFDGVPTYGRIPWHTDLAFQDVPNHGALLNMVKRATIGGQTAWLDTAAAYDAMPEALKSKAAKLNARFEFCADLAKMKFGNPNGVRVGEAKAFFKDYPAQIRPLIWAHPVTGRKIINLCPLNLQSIESMDAGEGDALILELIEAIVQPQFIYKHDWAEGDIILWDNYRTMHSAYGHPAEVLREAHRATIRGFAKVGTSVPIAVNA
jgi:taurine dioxygenase